MVLLILLKVCPYLIHQHNDLMGHLYIITEKLAIFCSDYYRSAMILNDGDNYLADSNTNSPDLPSILCKDGDNGTVNNGTSGNNNGTSGNNNGTSNNETRAFIASNNRNIPVTIEAINQRSEREVRDFSFHENLYKYNYMKYE